MGSAAISCLEGIQAENVTGCGGYPAGHAVAAGGQCIGSAGWPCWHGNPFSAVQVTLHNLLAPLAFASPVGGWGGGRGRWGAGGRG